MKQRLRLFKRGDTFYSEDGETGKQVSLGTKDRNDAIRLLEVKRQALSNPEFTRLLLKACAGTLDPLLLTRSWTDVMSQISAQRSGPTRERSERAFKSPAFNALRRKKLVETTSGDFLGLLNSANVSTHHYLRRLHNLALGLGWISVPVLAPRLWPKPVFRDKRAITFEEHEKILVSEKNAERNLFYQLLWEIGAAQSDAASLSAGQIDWVSRTVSFQRMKTGTWSHIRMGATLERLLQQLPTSGLLFPNISKTSANDRAAEFYRRCKLLRISGISLHSYRYAWAERAKKAAYPERFAQEALGHNSQAVHRAYSKGARVLLPPLDEYEKKQQVLP